MSRIRLALAAAAAAAVTGPFLAPASADPDTTPNGPWPGENDPSHSAIRSYEQLWSTLENIENRSQGSFDLSPAPRQTNFGRDIPVVTVGDGPTDIMLIANQHGNEYVVSEGMVDVVRQISGNSQQAQQIRDQLTVTVVPRVNVDGFDAPVTDLAGNTTPWRQNFDTDCPAFCEFYQEGRGYDPNRYHSYSESALDHPYEPGEDTNNPVPESIAMRMLWDERQPEVVVDFHHQGTYVDEDGRMITASAMWPNATETAAELGIADEFAETVHTSKQVVSQILDSLDGRGYANVTRYPGTTTPGIARNAYGLLGSASVLVEVRGGIEAMSNGSLTQHAKVSGLSILDAAADGSLFTRDTEPADTIRERGPSVGNPRGE